MNHFERSNLAFRDWEAQREQEAATAAWEAKYNRWKEMFTRHDPAENYRHKTEFLVEDFLPLGYTVLLASDTKEGKTALLDALALSVTKGEDFAGRKVRQAGVVWAAYEEKRNQRELNLCLDPHYNNNALDLYTAFKPSPLHDPDACEMLQCLCMEWKARLLVIDPLAGATGYHNLSEGHYVRRIMDTLNEVAYMCNLTVVVLHQASSLGNFRIADSIQIQAAAGMVMYYGRTKLDDGSHLVTLNSKGRGEFANQTVRLRSTSPLHYEPYLGEAAGVARMRSRSQESVLEAVRQGHATYAEIVAATKLNENTCRNILSKLLKEGALAAETARGKNRYSPKPSRLPEDA
ncbi:MAG TPA: AAA family ATPase [Fimbriimonas sp.]|nr:AAA family ATPase [Fimbriimonas sp.]